MRQVESKVVEPFQAPVYGIAQRIQKKTAALIYMLG
jgi:hypothetical protein